MSRKREDSFDYSILDELAVPGFEEQEALFRKSLLNLSSSDIDISDIPTIQNTLVQDHRKEKISYIETQTNMPFSTFMEYLKLSKDNEIILSFRDPGSASLERMKEGATGKSFTEKAKSSQYGASLAGYIPISQEFSKAGEKGQSEEYNKKVIHRIEESRPILENAIAIIERMNESASSDIDPSLQDLVSSNEIAVPKPLLDKEGRQIFGFLDKKGKALTYEGSKEPIFGYLKDGKYVDEKTGIELDLDDKILPKKIETLSYLTGAIFEDGKWKPKLQDITGDHDQLFIGVKAERGDVITDKAIMGKFGEQDDISIAVSGALIHSTMESGAVKHAADSGAGSHKGSLKSEHYELLSELSNEDIPIEKLLFARRMQEFRDKKIGGNPFPEDFEKEGQVQNYSFIIPADGSRPASLFIAHDQKEMTPLLNHLESRGFNIPINSRYGWARNEDGHLVLDKTRISAQIYKNELDSLKDKLPPEKLPKAKAKATAIYNLKEIIGIVALQEPSEEKEATLKTLNKRYIKEERRFYREFKTPSPVSQAIIDKSAKEKLSNEISKINAVNSIKKGAKIVNRTFSSVVTPKIEIQSSAEEHSKGKKSVNKSDLMMGSLKKTIKKISRLVNSKPKIQSSEKPREKTSKATADEIVQTLNKLSKEFSFKRIYMQPPAAKGKSTGKDDTGMGM